MHDVQDAPDVERTLQDLDLKLLTGPEWIELACLVRPLIFTDSDKIHAKQILQVIWTIAPSLRYVVDRANDAMKQWARKVYFALTVEEADPIDNTPDTIRLALDYDIQPSEVSLDFAMATQYLNGELFHVNLDYWVSMQDLGAEVRKWYLKAAQARVVSSCYYIDNVRRLVELGWTEGSLPMHESFTGLPA